MSQLEAKPGALGTGLDVLLNQVRLPEEEEFLRVPLQVLRPGKFQPRQAFDSKEMQELVDSIKQQGILQPILVRPMKEGLIQYEIVAGERRWQAAKQAGLERVPIWIRELTDKQALEMAIVENVQRQDLNLIEEAQAYKRLIDEFGYTHETVAESVRKSRSFVTNAIRLLTLPETIQESVRKNLISASHARTLINVENAEQLAEFIAQRKINVRQMEALKKQKKTPVSSEKVGKSPELNVMEENLSFILQMPVKISFSKSLGEITIKFKTLEQLDQLADRLTHHKGTTS